LQGRELAELLGQKVIAAALLEALEASDARLVRLTGPAGSGKSHIASQVAREWGAKRRHCVIAVGDSERSGRPLFPLLSGLTRAHRDWRGIASSSTRSASAVAGAAAGGGATGTSIFDLLSAPFRQQTERALRPYTPPERDVILELKRLARQRRLLVIADNAHWWDPDSLRLLCEVLSDSIRETLPQLRSVVALVVDTADEQDVVAQAEFDAVMSRCVRRTRWTSRCTREQFPDVLAAFGATHVLSTSTLEQLYSVTQGHLKLAEQIAASGEHSEIGAPSMSIDDTYVAALLSDRIASLGAAAPQVTDLLVRAAVLGLSCTEEDLGCIADTHGPDLRALVQRAERIGFIERAARQVRFSHDVIRTAVLGGQPSPYLEALYLKLAECLAILRPGDYEARGQALLKGGDLSRAREMFALAGIARIRRGVAAETVFARAELEFPDDHDLGAYLRVIGAGYRAVATGDFDAALPWLRSPLPNETTAMAAERNYIVAICSMGQQASSGREDALRVLSSWGEALKDEFELELRYLLLRQQGQVLSEMFDEARETEMLIEQRLTARPNFDTDAAVMRQVQNRRAGAVMAPEVAEQRIASAVEFFTRGTGQAGRDQLELFRSLTNLAAIEIRLDRNADAYRHALEAERVAVHSLEVGHRLDVLASNLVLAAHRSEAITLDETIARQALVVRSPEGSEDNFLQRCNLAAYLMMASRDDDAAAELRVLGDQVHAEEIDETYLVYYWSALSVAFAAVTGDREEAVRRHAEMDAFVAALKWPSAKYVQRRQELLSEELPNLVGNQARQRSDRTLIDGRPMLVGRAWAYYARLIPCCELSFWSDS
jgi:hypothetical protein